MTKSHKIGWLNLPDYKGETWNPIIGCSKISDGCQNYYAEKMAFRLANIPSTAYYMEVTRALPKEAKGWNGNTELRHLSIDKPIHWRKPRVIFVCSMGDLFHETVQFEWIDKVMSVIGKCPQHIFTILTKRPENAFAYYQSRGITKPPLNLWFGVTAENQQEANKRIPQLLNIPTAVHFVSLEPMLGGIKLELVDLEHGAHDFLTGTVFCPGMNEPATTNNKLDWVICGGESGHKARPMHPDWVRSIRDQCKEAETPFFFKQWGEWIPAMLIPEEWGHPADVKGKHSWVNKLDGKDTGEGEGEMTIKVGKHKSGNLLDGVKYEEYPKINNH